MSTAGGSPIAGDAREDVAAALRILLRRQRSLQPAKAIERICATVVKFPHRSGRFSRLEVAEGLALLARDRLVTGVTLEGRVLGRLGWTQPEAPAPDEFLEKWALAIEDLPPDRRTLLAIPPTAARQLSLEDVEALAACLRDFDSGLCPAENRYVLSAASLMGSSKLLDAMPGALSETERWRPLFVTTAGPATPETILFVENPSAFASLLATPFVERHMAICAQGYGLTIENLPRHLERGTLIPCAAAGEVPKDMGHLIDSRPCRFWGDLDLEGLRIYEALARTLPHLQLARIYIRMIARLKDPMRSHPYLKLFGKEGHRSPQSANPIVARLAELCALRAVDQEALCPVGEFDLLSNALGLEEF